MTNTEIEILLCTDCALIVANDDDSGCVDGEATRAALMERWFGYRLVVTGAVDAVFSHGDCDGCGALPGDRLTAVALVA